MSEVANAFSAVSGPVLDESYTYSPGGNLETASGDV